MGEFVNVYSNERIDREDLQALSDQDKEAFQKVLRDVFTGGSKARILGDWGVVLTNDTVTVTLGSAIGASKTGGQINYGQLIASGDTQRSVTTTGLGDANYTVWIRYVAQNKTEETRVFWDSEANAEFLESVSTRKVDNWGVRLRNDSSGSPGPEWIKLYTFNRAAGVNTVGAGQGFAAHYLFEGIGPDFDGLEWGDGPNDRNPDRAEYGLKDLGSWAAAVRRQLMDIMGDGGGWFQSVPYSLTNIVNGSQPFIQGTTLRARSGGDDEWLNLPDNAGGNNFQFVRYEPSAFEQDLVLKTWDPNGSNPGADWVEILRLHGGTNYTQVDATHPRGRGGKLTIGNEDRGMGFTLPDSVSSTNIVIAAEGDIQTIEHRDLRGLRYTDSTATNDKALQRLFVPGPRIITPDNFVAGLPNPDPIAGVVRIPAYSHATFGINALNGICPFVLGCVGTGYFNGYGTVMNINSGIFAVRNYGILARVSNTNVGWDVKLVRYHSRAQGDASPIAGFDLANAYSFNTGTGANEQNGETLTTGNPKMLAYDTITDPITYYTGNANNVAGADGSCSFAIVLDNTVALAGHYIEILGCFLDVQLRTW